MSNPLQQYTEWDEARFREGCVQLGKRMSDSGYQGVFQHEVGGVVGKHFYGLWVNLKEGKYQLTFTNRLGVTDYYDVTEKL